MEKSGGEGIRTPGGLTPTAVFKTGDEARNDEENGEEVSQRRKDLFGSCPKRKDRSHCDCWWDGEECCGCGAPASTTIDPETGEDRS